MEGDVKASGRRRHTGESGDLPHTDHSRSASARLNCKQRAQKGPPGLLAAPHPTSAPHTPLAAERCHELQKCPPHHCCFSQS